MRVLTGYMKFEIPDMSAAPSLRKRHGADDGGDALRFWDDATGILATVHRQAYFPQVRSLPPTLPT